MDFAEYGTDEKNETKKKIGRASKWVAGGALVLAGLAGPGVFFGWRNARADQAKANEARRQLATTENILETNQTKLDGYFAELSLACKSTVELYLHDGVNAEFSDGEAQLLVSDSGKCGNNQGVISEARHLDDAVEKNIAKITEQQADSASKDHDAALNYELWQGALCTIMPALVVSACLTGLAYSFDSSNDNGY